MTDPILRGIRQMNGAESIHVFQLPTGRWIYLFGENHDADGTQIAQVLVDYAKAHSVDIWLETTREAMLNPHQLITTSSVIDIISQYAIRPPPRANLKWRIFATDIRMESDSGYLLLQLLAYHSAFLERYVDLLFQDYGAYQEIWKHIKKAEKHLISAFSSRVSALRLLRGLLWPTHEVAGWFTECSRNLGLGETLPLRAQLATVKEENPPFYDDIVKHVEAFWRTLVAENEGHSRAMGSLANKRNSHSRGLAIGHYNTDRQDELEAYFLTITSVILDVQLLLHIYKNKKESPDTPMVICVGATHAASLATFLSHADALQ